MKRSWLGSKDEGGLLRQKEVREVGFRGWRTILRVDWSFPISFLKYLHFLLKMRNVFKCMLIAHPAPRIEKAVGRGCRADAPVGASAARDESLASEEDVPTLVPCAPPGVATHHGHAAGHAVTGTGVQCLTLALGLLTWGKSFLVSAFTSKI